jgi:hypothetical protein
MLVSHLIVAIALCSYNSVQISIGTHEMCVYTLIIFLG